MPNFTATDFYDVFRKSVYSVIPWGEVSYFSRARGTCERKIVLEHSFRLLPNSMI